MLQHVFERACLCRTLDQVIVATDDGGIAEVARGFGAMVQMTSASHLSGTDRVAEVSGNHEHEIVVNIQGDEPMIDPAAIDLAVQGLREHPKALMST